MSDFDKEAEREKLRQQYENDKEERQSTQRMSELLLQGATMTGKHCDTCGDPIFRQNGTEFCPTCQNTKQKVPEADSPTEQATAETGTTEGASEIEVEAAEQAGRNQATESARGEREQEAKESQQPNRSPNPPRQSRRSPPSQTGGEGHREGVRRSEQQRSDRQTRTQSFAAPEAGDLSEAREMLVRKLTTLAREAEATDDVGYSRELLAATREAAEALAALDRANR